MKRAIILILAAALTGCASSTAMRGPTDVIRYHLNQPITPGSVTVEPLSTSQTVSPEFQLYADAVAGELARLGFQPAPQGSSSQYVAAVMFRRVAVGSIQKPPPFSIGIGGASFGRRSGIGGGISTGIGGRREDVIATELMVQLRRRSDGTTIWEGSARRRGTEDRGQQSSAADVLAGALFQGFPGESGITISVP